MKQYILAIDQGTTSSRAILFDEKSRIVGVDQKEFPQYFRHPGWVEHNAGEIWQSVQTVIRGCLEKAGVRPDQIAGIGIANQRETTVIWEKSTGRPICPAIVWQSTQTTELCNRLERDGYGSLVSDCTGLRINPYFSATKIRWMLDSVNGATERAKRGELLAGTIDSWLIFCLSGGKVHATDYSNASRTMLYNIYKCRWEPALCEMLDIPMAMLPDVKDSCGVFATTDPDRFFGCEVPISGVAGDQQAALFGQSCFSAGMVKNTYGTGCFLLMNTGETPQKSQNGMLTTIAWGYQGKITYALEGSVFVAGSAIQWLRDEMGFFEQAAQSEGQAKQAHEDSSVIVVPAFTGLGAPYWDDRCRGAIFGLTRGTSKEDITKATLESLAFQTKDVILAMEEDAVHEILSLRVDGGASANDYLMRFQSDLLGCVVERPDIVETTALGAARLAGLGVGFWQNLDELRSLDSGLTEFRPKVSRDQAKALYQRWQNAVKAVRLMSQS